MLYVMLFCEYPFERPEDEADRCACSPSLLRTQMLVHQPVHWFHALGPLCHRMLRRSCSC